MVQIWYSITTFKLCYRMQTEGLWEQGDEDSICTYEVGNMNL
jgi:hypothetical protein